MISPTCNFREFLNTLAGTDRDEIILIASRERAQAKDRTSKRGKEHKAERQKQLEYISDLGTFLHFVRYSDNGGMSWREAFLASPEWKNSQRYRYGNLLGDE